jgi:hypothetical protein
MASLTSQLSLSQQGASPNHSQAHQCSCFNSSQSTLASQDPPRPTFASFSIPIATSPDTILSTILPYFAQASIPPSAICHTISFSPYPSISISTEKICYLHIVDRANGPIVSPLSSALALVSSQAPHFSHHNPPSLMLTTHFSHVLSFPSQLSVFYLPFPQ